MPGRILNLTAVARTLGFALVAVAIAATALHLRAFPARMEPPFADISLTPDPLAAELKRCQLIAGEAKDEPACELAWAESRRRFFTYAPPPTPASGAAATSAGR